MPRASARCSQPSAPTPWSTSRRNPTSTARSRIRRRSCAPTCSAPRCCSRRRVAPGGRRRRSAAAASITCRPTRATARRLRRPPGFTESPPYSPNPPYAASKAAADHLVRAYAHTYRLPCTISNCSNNYGPYQFPEKLLPLCILNILEGRPLPIYGDGLQIRDWLHVSDHCRAIDLILDKSPPGETWNVGGGTQEPNIAVVGRLCDLIDAAFAADAALTRRFPRSPAAQGKAARGLMQHVRDRPGHDRRYAVDSGKIRARLAFSDATELT